MLSRETPNQDISSEELFDEIIKSNKRQVEEEQKRPKVKAETIYNHEIAELETPIEKIIFDMKEKLEKGEYSVLIGEGASARLPALVMKKVIDHIYTQNGFSKPEIVFFGTHPYDDYFYLDYDPERDGEEEQTRNQEFNEALKKFSGKKALVITDHISHGTSVRETRDRLDNFKIESDVASITMGYSLEEYPSYLTDNLYYGTEHAPPPKVYARYKLSGVHKTASSAYPRRYESGLNLTESRSDVENVAKKIIENLEQNN